ncbi:hypothetical protein E4T56_gene505 [Termitomyces sp. T112]|nr:hypothetical protein E4T56_gene505 [Termitomyces sp. T112]
MNCRDIGEAGHSTLKGVAGSFAKGLVALPKVVTIPKGKGKGKEKAREEEEEEEKEEEEEEFVKPVQDTFTNMKLDGILVGGSEVAKGRRQEKSQAVVESEEEVSKGSSNCGNDNTNNVPLAPKCMASPALVTSTKQQKTAASDKEKEGEDVEMGESTPVATVAEVKGEEVMEVEENEESDKDTMVCQHPLMLFLPLLSS